MAIPICSYNRGIIIPYINQPTKGISENSSGPYDEVLAAASFTLLATSGVPRSIAAETGVDFSDRFLYHRVLKGSGVFKGRG